MEKIYRLSVLFFIAFMMIFLTNCSKEKKKDSFIVVTSPNNPPMEMISENKMIVGFDIDIIEAIAEKSYFSIKIIPAIRSNIFHGLIDSTYDIAISSIILKEEIISAENINVDFSEPYLEIGSVIVVSEDFRDYRGLKDLTNKAVGLEKDSDAIEILSKTENINTKEYSNIQNAFEDMASGKIHAVCLDLPSAARFVNLNEEFSKIFKIQKKPVTLKKYVIAVKTGNSDLLKRINYGIEKIKDDGTLTMLTDKWFFPK